MISSFPAGHLDQGLLQPGHIIHSKNFKTQFFRYISNSCQWVTQMGLEPQQKNFFEKFLKTKAVSPILSFLLFWQVIAIISSIFLEKLTFI